MEDAVDVCASVVFRRRNAGMGLCASRLEDIQGWQRHRGRHGARRLRAGAAAQVLEVYKSLSGFVTAGMHGLH